MCACGLGKVGLAKWAGVCGLGSAVAWAVLWHGECCGLGSAVGWGVGEGLGSGVGSGVGCGLGSGVGSGVGYGLGSGVGYGLGSGVGSGVGYGLGSGVGSGVGYGVGSGVKIAAMARGERPHGFVLDGWGVWVARARMRMCACTPKHSIQNKQITRRSAELERRRHAPAWRTARARPHVATRPRCCGGACGGAAGPWVGNPDGAE